MTVAIEKAIPESQASSKMTLEQFLSLPEVVSRFSSHIRAVLCQSRYLGIKIK